MKSETLGATIAILAQIESRLKVIEEQLGLEVDELDDTKDGMEYLVRHVCGLTPPLNLDPKTKIPDDQLPDPL